MTFIQILVLAVIQGGAELLPVSSSAHVIIAEKLMRLDPTKPEMTLLLVMLHTGTMFAVILYFWSSWKASFFASRKIFWDSVKLITIATVCTGLVGMALKSLIDRFVFRNVPHAEVELLFGNMTLIASALAAVGLVIIGAGIIGNRGRTASPLSLRESLFIGAVQGLCLPFRGFSRSGATISTGLLLGVDQRKAEIFSFALAVVLTPPIIAREVLRLLKTQDTLLLHGANLSGLFYPSLLGMMFSFISGFLALRLLSNWLERGRWQIFGYYCLCAATVVFLLQNNGF